MKHLVSIGELLIDFIPNQKGKSLSEVETFTKMAGGAPANVCAAFSKLGGKSFFMGKVGLDGFGNFLIKTLQQANVDTSHIKQTSEAKTALAFVSLTSDGERDFSFYRNPSADQLFNDHDINYEVLEHSILHFCSVSLLGYPISKAHETMIMEAKRRNAIISFDPNVRRALSTDDVYYQAVILKYLKYADIVKVSDDELSFITGIDNLQDAIKFLLNMHIPILIVTKGKYGADLYFNDQIIHEDGLKVEIKDTTGAGDAWIGAFLYHLSLHANIYDISIEQMREYLKFSNLYAALTVTKYGAIDAMPTRFEMDDYIKKMK
jgi:fructokinase